MTSFAYFDCASGIAGDMAVGALLDLGYPVEELTRHVHAMGLPVSVSLERTRRGGLAASRYRVESATEQTHRGLSDCLGLVGRAGLAPRAEKLAGEVFRRLARVEATLHGTSVEEVHFHEVGAADALADVVGFAAAYIGLGLSPGEAVASPLPFARGSVGTAHGALPLPAPA